jgi:hypothetical protein
MRSLNLIPSDYDKSTRDGFRDAMNGLLTAVRGLCQLRNNEGVFSHGKSTRHQNLDLLQIRLAAEAADAIATYLYRSHLKYPFPSEEFRYEVYDDFNDYIDEMYGTIEILDQMFLPSKILYNSDEGHATYREALEQYNLQEVENSDEETRA